MESEFDPTDYYFDVHEADDEEGGDVTVVIVKRDFWDANHCIDSRHLYELANITPPCIVDEIAEGTFVSEVDRDDTVEEMQQFGFNWNAGMLDRIQAAQDE
jgi:hypothetical protein